MKGPEVAIKAGRENKQSQNKEEEQIQVDRVHSEGRIEPPSSRLCWSDICFNAQVEVANEPTRFNGSL